MDEQKMREAFEKEAARSGIYTCGFARETAESSSLQNKHFGEIKRVNEGDYVSNELQAAWLMWQAATAATQRDAMAVAEAVLAATKSAACISGTPDFPYIGWDDIDLTAIVEAVRPGQQEPVNQQQAVVYHKFNVSRTDGRDQPGGDRHGAEYFVLDVTHDEFAKPALAAYAAACRDAYPSLADDMVRRYAIAAAEAAQPEYVDPELEHMAEEAECVAMCLNDRNVPTHEDGKSLSLWGRVERYAKPKFSEEWRTYEPNVSSEHIAAIAKACKLIPSHTTKELVERVVGFGHVLLGDKAVQEKFVEANAHLLRAAPQPASAQPAAVPEGYVLAPMVPTQAMNDAGRNALAAGAVPMEKVYRAMLSAAPKPEGWQLVPKEVTQSMELAWRKGTTFENSYAAMLAAAPKPEGGS